MSLNLMIALLALTVIMTSVNRIEMAPTKSATSKDYYLTRAWGESSVPFTVIYSNYARTKAQQKPTTSNASTTVAPTPPPPPPPPPPPTQRKRRPNTTTTKKPSQLPNLFVSNGWGPLG